MIMPLFDLANATGRAPLAMKGGKLFDVWKQKADPACCDNSRGILVSDHLSKWYCVSLAEPVFKHVHGALGEAQCGSVPGRDATLLTAALQTTFVERNLSTSTSWALLFLDLAKAFDSVIREYLYGVDHVRLDALAEELQSVGIPMDVAQEVQRYLQQHPPLLQQAGLQPDEVHRVADWHTGTWFAVRGEDDEVVLARRGARQGCRLGAICFNLGYELGLGRARERFLKEGIALQLTTPNTLAVPWSTVLDGNASLHDLTYTPNDAEYVDDSVFAFQQEISGTPEDVLKQLDRATDILVEEFDNICLTSNFGPGKSAAMVKLYGTGARKLRQSRLLHEGKEQFTTSNGHVLQVVHHFQHLGTVLQDTGGHQEDGRRKASKAQKAFAPLAVPIFGSSHIQAKTKLMLAQSLVLSRSLYAVAAWRGKLDKGWLPIEAQYHRVLRRINGTMRYGAPDTVPDAAYVRP